MNLAINTAPTPLAAIQASRRRNALAMLGIHSGHADGPLGRRWQGPQAYAEKLLLATARLYGRLGRVWPASLRAVFTCTRNHRPADPGRACATPSTVNEPEPTAAAPFVATVTTPAAAVAVPPSEPQQQSWRDC
jgi:hypothetical protein